LLRSTSIAAILSLVAVLGTTGEPRAQAAAATAVTPPDSAATDSTVVAPPDSVAVSRPDSVVSVPDSLRAVTIEDSLGIPGTLQGLTQDPAGVKATLSRMGSSEIEGRTEWERKKNPRVAMLCSALLPGLGQTYNGRRLKVGVMVGFASYYMGTMWLNYRKYEGALMRRDAAAPGSEEFAFENRLADFYKEEARTYLWWSGAVWLLGLIDSWIDAHLYDVRSYTPPSPPEGATPRAVNERTSYITVGFGLEFSQ
jgi:hypothetical protein